MKQLLLGTPLGRGAMLLRDTFSIARMALVSPEEVGTLANDQLASHLITKICKPNGTFIDIGAHIGSIIADVHCNDPSIRIMAIEAVPEKAQNLRRKFPFIELHNCAVGETTGEMSFFVNTRRSGYSSLGRPSSIDTEATLQTTVQVEKLDNLVSSTNVDAIKIDVEGAELGVLRGGIDTLRKYRPILMFESGPQADDGLGYSKEAIYDFLISQDYSVFVPNRVAHNGDGLTLTGFIDSHIFPRRTTNYF